MAQQVIFNEKALKQALIPQCGGNEQVANTVGNLIVKQLEATGVVKTTETQPEATKPEAPKPVNTERVEHLVGQLVRELGPQALSAAKDGILIVGRI